MQPSTNNPTPVSAPQFKTRLRQDQLLAIQSLLLVGVGVLFLSLFHATWPLPIVGGVAGVSALLLATSAYFWGRFQVGQHLLLSSIAVDAPSAQAARSQASQHKVQVYVSVDEARQHGWSFFDACGRHGGQPIPRWAHDGEGWFEYDGLDTGKGTANADHRRVFGALVYQLSPVAPGTASSLPPLAA